ncbi:MAG TPA: ATP-binding cassette domain-containing protein, partial [Actinomycetota bacterium]|nr:ATP-binding cassette domain-containing protein [Actinomycetota bacterium]
CPQVPEDVLFQRTVLDEVGATIRARGRRPPAGGPEARGGKRGAAMQLLEALGLDDLAARHPRDLSAGERLLVAVAAVAATGAPVLLLDEPTRGLDQPAKARLSAIVRGIASGGGAVAFATHDVELAAALATRVVLLAGGEVIADGAPEDVLADSPVFSPEMTRVFGPGWLTPEQVARALGA